MDSVVIPQTIDGASQIEQFNRRGVLLSFESLQEGSGQHFHIPELDLATQGGVRGHFQNKPHQRFRPMIAGYRAANRAGKVTEFSDELIQSLQEPWIGIRQIALLDDFAEVFGGAAVAGFQSFGAGRGTIPVCHRNLEPAQW